MTTDFSPPTEEEIKRAKAELAAEKKRDLYAPPTDEELLSVGIVPKGVQDKIDFAVSDEGALTPPEKKEVTETIQKGIGPVPGQDGFWGNLASYLQSASNGFLEGATANKTAEIAAPFSEGAASLGKFLGGMSSREQAEMSALIPLLSNKNNVKDFEDAIETSKQQNPLTFGAANIAGAIAGAPLYGAGKLGPIAYSALAGAEGETPQEKLIGAGIGGALGAGLSYGLPAAIKKVAPYAASAAGKLAQIPQQIEEAILEPTGEIAKRLPFMREYIESLQKNNMSSALFSDSRKVKDLKDIADVASLSQMGGETANAVKTAEREVLNKLGEDKSIGGKLTEGISNFLGSKELDRFYGPLSEPEKAVVMAAMARGFEQRGLKTDPETLKAVFEDMASGSGLDLNKTSIKDVIRTLNRRDPAWAVAAFRNVANFFNPLLEKTGNVAPEYFEAQLANQQLGNLLENRSVNRMMQLQGRPTTYQLPLEQVGLHAQDASRLAPSVGEVTSAATPSAKEAAQKTAEMVTKKTPWLGDLSEETIKKRTGINPTDEQSLQRAGAIAANKLNNIEAGKSFTNIASGLWGGGEAWASHNPLSAIPGFTPQAISWAGKIGQGLEDYGKNLKNPEVIANSVFGNPSMVQHLARQPGRIGRVAQYLDDEFQKNGIEGLKSRLFVMMTSPMFREIMTEYVQQNQEKRGNPPNDSVNLNP